MCGLDTLRKKFVNSIYARSFIGQALVIHQIKEMLKSIKKLHVELNDKERER